MSMNARCIDLSGPIRLAKIGPGYLAFSQEGKLPLLKVSIAAGKMKLETVRIEDVTGTAVLANDVGGREYETGRIEVFDHELPAISAP